MNSKNFPLNSEKYALQQKNEKFAYLLGIFTQFVWSVNGLQLKSIEPKFPEYYSLNSIMLWRTIPVVIIAYNICKYKNIPITPHSKIKHLTWFFIRNFGNYFFVLLNIKVLSYFRLSTSRVFLSCQPLIIIFLSIFILSEKFYIRYLIGIIICLIGSSIIALNDKKPQSKNTILNDNIFEGLIFAILLLITASLNSIGQKIMSKDGMDPSVQNFYLGIYNGLPGLIVCIYQKHFGIKSLKYILYDVSNGLVFYCGHYFTGVCFKYIAISKFIPVTYLVVVFTFLLSIIVLREPLFFTDVLGAVLIIGFQFYNVTYPVGKNENNNNVNYKEKFLDGIKNDNNNNSNEDEIVIEKISNIEK